MSRKKTDQIEISVLSCDSALRSSIEFRLLHSGYAVNVYGCSAIKTPPPTLERSRALIVGEDAFKLEGDKAFNNTSLFKSGRPIFLLSSCITPPLVQRCMKFGVHGVFEMPFLDKLWERISELGAPESAQLQPIP